MGYPSEVHNGLHDGSPSTGRTPNDNSVKENSTDGGHVQREDRSGSDITTSDDMEMEDMRSDEGSDDNEEMSLTQSEHKKRKLRAGAPTDVNQATITRGDDDFQEAEKRLVNANLVKNLLTNALLIALWYSFSISISVYNKWMFSSENLDFHYPLFTTSIHMLVQFSLATLVLWVFPRFRPGRDGTADPDPHGNYSRVNGGEDESQQQPSTTKPLMTKAFYFTRIAPCGTATALDIGLGNFSLRFITLTFFTMCKSSVLAFVLLFAFLFRLEKPTWKLCAVILFMTVGVIMMVAGEAAFDALGFMLVMTASFCSGFRWSLTQILLLRNAATSNPFSSIFFLTPVMFVALFVLALPIEGPKNVIEGLHILLAAKGTFLGVLIMLFPGVLAFMMVAAEFALIKRTSVVTLSVCGIFKEVLTISAASLSFGDDLTPINISGLFVTIASIAGYNWLKYTNMQKEARKEAHEIMDESDISHKDARGAEDVQEDEYVVGRDSTSTVGLMRDSLTLATDVEPGGRYDVPRGSPSKRREDLE